MPFTATHLAAALPIAWLCRWRVPFTALAAGTLVADVGVFFPAFFDYRATHSLPGIITHCAPIGLAAYYLYHLLLKRPLLDLLPLAARNRLLRWGNRPVDFSLNQIALVSLLIMIGSATHVLWDSFTHRNRWGVNLVPILKEVGAEFGRHKIPWYTFLQHGSSLVLLPPMLLGFCIWVWRQKEDDCNDDRVRLPPKFSWTAIAAILLGGFAWMWWIQWCHPNYLVWMHSFRFAVKDTGAVLAVTTLVYCLTMHVIWLLTEAPTES